MRKVWSVLAILMLCVGCGEAVEQEQEGKAEESPLLEQAGGKEDSFRKPTELGVIELGQSALAALSRDAGYLTWTFTLYDEADVSINTELPFDGSQDVDTVLYLYKKQPNGNWGSYIARNDDVSRDVFWSAITRTLGAGEYRILVKGYSDKDFGEFALDTACEGAGCQLPFNPGCLFGDTFRDARQSLVNGERRRLYAADTLTALEEQQFIASLHASGRDEVTDLASAFDAVDSGELNIYALSEQGGQGRSFLAFEYGLGDNSYGAIFEQGSATPAARINDGDIYDCAVQR